MTSKIFNCFYTLQLAFDLRYSSCFVLRSTSLGATDIVRLAVITRLEMTRPYIKRWPEALAVMAHPTNTVMSFAQLGKLVDDIWYYAGDKSPDVRICVVHLYGS